MKTKSFQNANFFITIVFKPGYDKHNTASDNYREFSGIRTVASYQQIMWPIYIVLKVLPQSNNHLLFLLP